MIMFRQDNDIYTDEAGSSRFTSSTVSVTTTSGAAANFQRYSSTSLRGSSGVYEDVNYNKLNHDRSPQQDVVPPLEVNDVSDNSRENGKLPPRVIAVESYVQSDPDHVVTAQNCCFSRMTYFYIGIY